MPDFKVQMAKAQSWIQKNPWKTVAAIFLAFAAWFLYQGSDIYLQNKAERDVLEARDQVVSKAGPLTASYSAQMMAAYKISVPTMSDEGLKLTFKNAVQNSESVEVFAIDLDAPYENPIAFGVGKLAVLESSVNDQGVAMRVIRVGDATKLGLAKSIGSGSDARLVYVQVPIEAIKGFFNATLPANTFLALRQGQVDLLKSGNDALASTAEMNAVKLPNTPWRVVASAPLADQGLFNAKGFGEIGLAVLFLVLAFSAFKAPGYFERRRNGHGEYPEGAESALTLEQMKAQGLIDETAAEQAPVLNIVEAVRAKVPLERSIFRAYDIRGVVGTNLDAGIARMVGEAVGSELIEKGLRGIVVGYDGRLSSPEIAEGLIQGLCSTGVAVVNIGMVPTPLVYFAANNSEYTSGISVTGSHNPPDYNGLKIVIDGNALSGDAITGLFDRIVEKRIIQSAVHGAVSRRDIVPDYTRYIADDIQIDRPLRVVVDCGNGVPGAVAPEVLRAIGADVEEIYCEVDGNFPNHHPDPSDPDNLIDLIELVRRSGADLGLAFDGDGDRLGVVTSQGEMIFADRLLMLFAEDVLNRHPGAAIIFDVKCTAALQGHILKHGGSPVMWKTGHSLIKAKMKETHAELAGEMSGHFFFAERWFGFDDGIYAAARLLEILAAAPEGIQSVFDELPKMVSTAELKIDVEEGRQHVFIDHFQKEARFEGARINQIDGLRADWKDGWGLVRASNTTPVLVLRFEAETEESLARIQNEFRSQLLALDPELKLPF
jgi:phosphomannomutase/phosphoglucomutase